MPRPLWNSGRVAAAGTLVLLSAVPLQAQSGHGIYLGRPKVFNTRTPNLMIGDLSAQLARVNAVEQAKVLAPMGAFQGMETRESIVSGTLGLSKPERKENPKQRQPLRAPRAELKKGEPGLEVPDGPPIVVVRNVFRDAVLELSIEGPARTTLTLKPGQTSERVTLAAGEYRIPATSPGRSIDPQKIFVNEISNHVVEFGPQVQ